MLQNIDSGFNLCNNKKLYAALKSTVFFIGLEDEGFETLQQLAYLYLANNKVSHKQDFKMSQAQVQ